MRFLLTILFLVILASCSDKSPTKASLRLELSNHALNSLGGLVIFGTEVTGRNFTRVIGTSSVTMELPKGNWNIGAIAWDGSSGPMTGVVICDSQSVLIDTDTETVNLTLTNSNCFSSTFSTEIGQGSPLRATQIVPEFCEAGVSGNSSTCDYNPVAGIANPKRGFIGSFKFSIPAEASFFAGIPAGEILESDCFVAGTNTEVAGSDLVGTLNIPAFAANLGVPLHIDAYFGTACENSQGFLRKSFRNPDHARFRNDTTYKSAYASVPLSEVCSTSNALNLTTGFASGTGTSAFPYVICNARQLQYLQQLFSTYGADVFILGADIDLISLYTDPNREICLEPGDSLPPIGTYYSSSPGPCTLSDSTATGLKFDGNDKTIKNFRFKASSSNKVALFDEIGSTGYITNLTLENAKVEGANYTAGIVASMSGTLQNVAVKNSSVRGLDFTGGIVGYLTTPSSLLFGKRIKVEGANRAGGLIGESTNSLTSASFSGEIYSKSSSAIGIGGIVGYTSASLSQVASTGVLRAAGTYIGGIAGNGTNVDQARSEMYINDLTGGGGTYRYIGGLLGTGTAVTGSLFTGYLSTTCSGGIFCFMGGISGSAVTLSDGYNTQSLSLGGTDGTSITLSGVQTGNTLKTGLCTTLGAACKWNQTSTDNDIPRLPFESLHPCTQAINNSSFTTQFALQSTRGTESDPYIICKTTQLSDIPSVTGKYVSIKRNLNLSQIGLDNLTGSLTSFVNGNGHVLHSWNRTNDNSKAMFTSIGPGASLINLLLVGFNFIHSTNCSSCKLAAIAWDNYGTIKNVQLLDSKITANSNSAVVSGLASQNMSSGKISYVRFEGNLQNSSYVGGIVAKNFGSVTDSKSDAKISSNGYTASYLGGIVAYSEGDVERSSFSGDIYSIGSGSSKIGGIVGELFPQLGASLPVLRNNHFEKGTIDLTSTTATFVGGIVGYADQTNGTSVVDRNVNGGFINEGVTDQSSVLPLLGSGSLSIDQSLGANFSNASTYTSGAPVTGTSSISYNVPSGICTLKLPATYIPHPSGYAFKFSNEYFHTRVPNHDGVNFTLDVPMSNGKCSSYSGISNINTMIYKAYVLADFPTVADLQTNFYDVAVLPADLSTVLNAYMSFWTTGSASSAPVWIYERNEDGLKLFSPWND